MNIQSSIEKMKSIQNLILEFIDNEDAEEENYQNILKLYSNFKIGGNKNELKSFLYLISKISNNHYRNENFFSKIEKIILNFKKDIDHFFTYFDIFQIFIKNKRILLFLIESKIIEINQSIVNAMLEKKYYKMKYPQYFYPEIKSFINKELIEHIQFEIPENFDEKRKIGENDYYLCELIRKDKIEEFITYINQNSLSLNSIIENSIYETNPLLLKKKISLIEYATFFGSIQIFKYLMLNGAKLTKSIWNFAIHGEDQEIIDILLKSDIEKLYEQCIFESIKCHHNHIVNYFRSNLIEEITKADDNEKILKSLFHYYNFSFFPDDFNYKFIFYYCCKYDYYDLVDYLIKNKKILINEPIEGNITALHLAAKKNNIEIVNLLLSQQEIQIGDDCFLNCQRLEKLSIPSFITFLGNNAFKNCSSLISIDIPSSVVSFGKNLFDGCSSLVQVSLPSTLKIIDEYMFNECQSLTEILIPSSVDRIECYSFKKCSSLKKIEIPSSVTLIECHCFEGCTSLNEVIIHSSLQEIIKYTFYGCTSLREINIPSTVHKIGSHSFENCISLTQVIIPSSVTRIKNAAFNKCSSLKEILFPSSLKYIGICAFKKCSSLLKITIPSSVEVIASSAFESCSSLKEVIFEKQSVIKEICSHTFMKCISLINFDIPSSVQMVEFHAFEDCSSLSKIDIPPSVSTIYKSSFKGCVSLLPNSIPENLLVDDTNNGCILI